MSVRRLALLAAIAAVLILAAHCWLAATVKEL